MLLVIPIILGVVGFSCLALLMTSGADLDKPMPPPATFENANTYFQISNETGAPWDLVVILDTLLGDKDEQPPIGKQNPLLTSLQFCQMTVNYYSWGYSDSDSKNKEWILDVSGLYVGADEILEELSLSDKTTLDQLLKTIVDADYQTDSSKRETVISLVSPDSLGMLSESGDTENQKNSLYKNVIKTYYDGVFEDDEVEEIFEILQTGYIQLLYRPDDETYTEWDMSEWSGSDILPEITVGDVSRLELIEIAASLIDYPYYFGGKSPYPGEPRPTNGYYGLDCSGYVDWVFVQAFGKPVDTAGGGCASQMMNCTPITAEELQIGDLGFYYMVGHYPKDTWNHVGIYVGKIDGKDAFIHDGWGYTSRADSGQVVISINDNKTRNQINPLGGTLPYEVYASNFVYFGRPPFQFNDDESED